jgi:bifunctional DNA-binding transcriptional regulator/antitoxin component of YhaV-PrlF toxin-antitoxin module
MPNTATLSAQFQLAIPKSLCIAQGWKAGQEFAFIPKGAGVLLVPVPDKSELFGIAKGGNPQGSRERVD